MIKEAGIVREPRGISWQNWTATCKDVLTSNARYLMITLLVVAAAVGGTLYVKHASTASLARHSSKPATSGKQVNLNTSPTTLPNAASQSAPAGQAINASKAVTSVTKSKLVTPTCDIATQTAAELQYNTNLTLENTYHTTQLTLLGVTGVVGSLLGNPNAAKITSENARHQNVLDSLQATLNSQLATAHCTQ